MLLFSNTRFGLKHFYSGISNKGLKFYSTNHNVYIHITTYELIMTNIWVMVPYCYIE